LNNKFFSCAENRGKEAKGELAASPVAVKKRDAKSLLFHLIIWVTIPTILRSLALSHNIDLASGPGGAAFLGGFFFGFFQDLSLAFEIYILLGLLRLLWGRRNAAPRSLLLGLSTFLFSLAHLYLFIDILLVFNLGIRINSVFFYFFGDIRPFLDSAKNLGLFPFLLLFLFSITFSTIAFYNYFKKFEAPRLTFWIAGTTLAVFLLAIFSQSFLSPEVKYLSDNPIFTHQYALMSRFLSTRETPRYRISKKDILAILPSKETEDFSLISNDFPLLKMTKGFRGPKSFNIEVGRDERPHLIFLFLESFRARDVGVLGSDKGATPVFDRLSKEGVLFENFYSTGAQTTRAVVSSLFGIMPRFTAQSIQSGDPDLPLIGVADLLSKREYRSAYFHNGSLEFEGKQAFFSRHGYSEIYGKDDLIKYFPSAQKNSWGIHDEYLMLLVANWLAQKDRKGQPAFITMFTVTTHHPFKVPRNYHPPNFRVSTKDPSHSFFKNTGKGLYKRYLETIHYADYCLGLFIKLLKEKDIYEKSIIFILGDNSMPMGEHNNYFAIRFLYEENLRIPLLILAPGRLTQPALVCQPASQADLLLTVMDILRLSGLNHAIGASLVRKAQSRAIFFDNPFELKYRGLRKGFYKFIYSKQQDRTLDQLYNLKDDPDETTNLVGPAGLRKAYFSEAERVHLIFETLYHQRNFAPPRSRLK